MTLRTKILIILTVICAISFFSSPYLMKNANLPKKSAIFASSATSWINDETKKISAESSNLNPKVLRLSLIAYLHARKEGLDTKKVLTIVDYSKPSSERRLWVIDLKSDKVLINTWVAHGRNSGGAFSTAFSNQDGSLKSSIGVLETEDTYFGHDGYALRVRGLERGVNDHVYARAIVVHGAYYAGGDVAKSRGMLGRSWGCLAVGEDTVHPLINTIKNNTIVVAYYPDKHWLQSSPYLNVKSI